MVSEEKFKSGPEVVSDFLEALRTNKEADEKIVDALTSLLSEGKLSKTRLLNSLQTIRDTLIKPTNGSPKEST